MRRRIAATAILAAGLMLGTTGCTFFAPQATLIPYDASDGVSLNVGQLQVRNALAISPHGKDASLIGVFINNSDHEITVNVQYTARAAASPSRETVSFPLAAGKVLSLGNPGVPPEVLRNAGIKPGALLTVFVQYGEVSGKNVQVPVLTGSEASYVGLAPSPTPTPTGFATPIPTLTAVPTN
ncbi:MAG TPA: hypothetical protein VGI56_04650 [Galbitalea sp.]